jgi:hypothetical protein
MQEEKKQQGVDVVLRRLGPQEPVQTGLTMQTSFGGGVSPFRRGQCISGLPDSSNRWNISPLGAKLSWSPEW